MSSCWPSSRPSTFSKRASMASRSVTERLAREGFSRVTPDYDGSVSGTGRHAEGTATGCNRKRKGARSCHPLLRTIARTDRVPDVHHRPGNVHDSNGVDTFISRRMSQVRSCLPHAKIETRIDGAFPDETIVQQPHSSKAEFTASVPFERFPVLKDLIEGRKAGIAWRRELIVSKPVGSRSRGMPAIASSSSEGRSGINTSSPSNPICPDPSNTAANSMPSSPTSERTRAISLPSVMAAGRQEGIFAEPGAHCRMDCIPVRDPGRQPTVHVRRHPCPQPHPRAPDPNRCPGPRHDPEACRVTALPGDGNPSS